MNLQRFLKVIYMNCLKMQGLQDLIRQEHRKAHGIINGIDTEVWNPMTDIMLYEIILERILKKEKKKKKMAL